MMKSEERDREGKREEEGKGRERERPEMIYSRILYFLQLPERE